MFLHLRTNVTVYKQSEGIQHCNTVMSCATNATVKATKTHILSWKATQKQTFYGRMQYWRTE